MAKGQQRSNKEAKKPKKDAVPARTGAPLGEPVRPQIVTAILPKGKERKKQ